MHYVDAKGILTSNSGMHGMNIYRGCTHGCIYCDSRSKCYQFTHDFDDIHRDRTLLQAAAAANASENAFVVCRIVNEFVHESLAETFNLCKTRVAVSHSCEV